MATNIVDARRTAVPERRKPLDNRFTQLPNRRQSIRHHRHLEGEFVGAAPEYPDSTGHTRPRQGGVFGRCAPVSYRYVWSRHGRS